MLDDVGAFLDEAAPLLLADEARHNLILGIAGTIAGAPDLYPERRFWSWRARRGRGRRRAADAAVQPRPRPPADDGALEALADAIDDDLPGVVGAAPEVDEFAQLVGAAARPIEPRIDPRQGVYALERRPRRRRGARGALRTAGARRPRRSCSSWMLDFGVEALHEDEPAAGRRRSAPSTTGSAPRDGGFLALGGRRRGGLASPAGAGRPRTGSGSGRCTRRPTLRGRGYATALVAELSQSLLDSGRRFCFLYTDLANPTSNAIYERIGYVRVCEAAMVAFERHLEELLELHRRAHVALDLQLPVM